MVRISFIVSVRELVDTVTKAFAEHTAYFNKDDIEYSLSVFVAPTINEMKPAAVEADIVITRGVLVNQLERKYPQIAVVPVPISGTEIISAILKAVDSVGKAPVAVLGASNVIYSANGLDKILNLDIKGYLQKTNVADDLDRVFGQILADGRKIVVCGPHTAKYAAKFPDLCSIVLGMSKESIWQAISEAKHLSAIRRKEFEKATQFKAILDSAIEGIMVVDDYGRITVLNAVGERLLGIKASEAVGQSVSTVFPRSRFSTILRSSIDYTQEIVRYRDSTLSLNKIGLVLRSDNIGNVITFQEIGSIQREEIHIRNKMYLKGHVAKYRFTDIIGESAALKETIGRASNFASVNSNVLIAGETGTGKEMFAQSIHNSSPRRDGPFVAINCAALSPTLLESELFGYVDGAFTGAAKGGKPGLFELAHSGSIFLDEISEIPLEMQGRLLRVIQERQIMRLGDDRVIPVDVRVLSATNKPLLSLVRRHEFRSDLYYRLNVLTLRLPPLSARAEDILLLADTFLAEYAEIFGRGSFFLSPAARKALVNHCWEGNIRELRNVCECVAACRESGPIQETDIAVLFDRDEDSNCQDIAAVTESSGATMVDIEKTYLLKALEDCSYDRNDTARRLGISKTTLWRRLKKYGIAIR